MALNFKPGTVRFYSMVDVIAPCGRKFTLEEERSLIATSRSTSHEYTIARSLAAALDELPQSEPQAGQIRILDVLKGCRPTETNDD